MHNGKIKGGITGSTVISRAIGIFEEHEQKCNNTGIE